MFKAGFDRALFYKYKSRVYKYKSRALSAKPNYKSCVFLWIVSIIILRKRKRQDCLTLTVDGVLSFNLL